MNSFEEEEELPDDDSDVAAGMERLAKLRELEVEVLEFRRDGGRR